MKRPPVPRPAGASRYTWFLGVVLFLAVVGFTINTATTQHASSTGVPVNSPLPAFAIPLALSPLKGDANVSDIAHPSSAGRRPACEVRGRSVLNVCQLAERGPVVLAFLATRGARCLGEVDRLNALRSAFPGVQMAAIAIRGDRDDLRRTITSRGWRLPVGYDHDGALANLYGVAVCPQITLASVGGIVRANLIGEVSTARLRRALRALVADSVRLHWRQPHRA